MRHGSVDIARLSKRAAAQRRSRQLAAPPVPRAQSSEPAPLLLRTIYAPAPPRARRPTSRPRRCRGSWPNSPAPPAATRTPSTATVWRHCWSSARARRPTTQTHRHPPIRRRTPRLVGAAGRLTGHALRNCLQRRPSFIDEATECWRPTKPSRRAPAAGCPTAYTGGKRR